MQKLEKNPIKAFIFDMDGTIFDTERLYVKIWKMIGQEKNLNITDEMLESMRGMTREKVDEIFLLYNPSMDLKAARNLRTQMLDEYIKKNGVPKKAGLDTLLQYLKAQHYKIAIGSSTGYEGVMKYLKAAHMENTFDFVGCGNMVNRSKPAPDLFQLCAQELGCSPKACVVVEDSPNGIKAGLALGGYTIGVQDITDITLLKPELDGYFQRLDNIIDWVEHYKKTTLEINES